MTTKELIECLQKLDPNGSLRVVTHGYEYGVDDIQTQEVRRVFIQLNVYSSETTECGGPHEVQAKKSGGTIEAILVS